jgi:hypothetical protein
MSLLDFFIFLESTVKLFVAANLFQFYFTEMLFDSIFHMHFVAKYYFMLMELFLKQTTNCSFYHCKFPSVAIILLSLFM